jgi:hypothetical protein
MLHTCKATLVSPRHNRVIVGVHAPIGWAANEAQVFPLLTYWLLSTAHQEPYPARQSVEWRKYRSEQEADKAAVLIRVNGKPVGEHRAKPSIIFAPLFISAVVVGFVASRPTHRRKSRQCRCSSPKRTSRGTSKQRGRSRQRPIRRLDYEGKNEAELAAQVRGTKIPKFGMQSARKEHRNSPLYPGP